MAVLSLMTVLTVVMVFNIGIGALAVTPPPVHSVSVFLVSDDEFDVVVPIEHGHSFDYSIQQVLHMALNSGVVPILPPGVAFTYWYTDAARTMRYDGCFVTEDMHLYAGLMLWNDQGDQGYNV